MFDFNILRLKKGYLCRKFYVQSHFRNSYKPDSQQWLDFRFSLLLECPKMVFYSTIWDLMQNPISNIWSRFTCPFINLPFIIYNSFQLRTDLFWQILNFRTFRNLFSFSHSGFSKKLFWWLVHVKHWSSNLFCRLFALCFVYQRLDINKADYPVHSNDSMYSKTEMRGRPGWSCPDLLIENSILWWK